MGMKGAEVVAAFPAEQRHLSIGTAILFHRGKGAICILQIGGCHQHAFQLLHKLRTVAAARAAESPQRLPQGKLDLMRLTFLLFLLHRIHHITLSVRSLPFGA